jgi:hypothetical protein
LQVGTTATTVEVTANATTLDSMSANIATVGKLSPVANRPHVEIGSGSGGGALGMALPAPPPASPASLEEAREMSEAPASGQELGDLFE